MLRLAVFAPALALTRQRHRADGDANEEWGSDVRRPSPNRPRKVESDDSGEKSSAKTEGDDAEEGDGGDARSMFQSAGGSVAPDPQGQYEDDDEHWKVKHRYLPILSGLACPFSVLLDVPGLTERWYIKTDGFDVIETQPNPALLDVALAVSIAFGIIANAALITRFLERRPRISTLVAILALTIHDIINIVTVTVFGVVHRFNDGFTYGTAFWLCVASTVASLICNVTLIFDYASTKDFVRNGSGLTEKQRSLVIAVMALLCYIGLGSLVFSFLIDLTYINSLYFTICTITSVGFGDITPKSLASRLFSFFYDVAGLVLIAFTIALARETVIETFEASYRRRREHLAAKARVRKEEKRRHARERKERRERELEEASANPDTLRRKLGVAQPTAGGGRGGAGALREQIQLDYEQDLRSGISAGKAWLRRTSQRFGWDRFRKTDAGAANPCSLQRTLTDQSIISEDSYKTFRKEMEKEQAREFRLKISIASLLFWVFWLVGSAVFHFTEGWTYFEALYFCFIFFTTIGYGDFSPQSAAGRAFFVAWAILGIATMTLLLSVVTETWSSRYKSSITQSKVQRSMRRVRTRSEQSGAITAMKSLLALEGVEDEDSIAPKDLPGKLTEAVKGFHDHARFFMMGRTGDTPPRLRVLIDAGDELEDELNKLKDSGDFTETGGGETRHFLFMVSYERQFDVLLDAAASLDDVFKNHAAELETMRTLNEELRAAVEEAKQPVQREEQPFPFGTRRPPGGDGDDETEERLVREIDGESTVDDSSAPGTPQRSSTPLASGSNTPTRARIGSVSDTLHTTSLFIRKLQNSKAARVALHRRASDATTPGVVPDPIMVGSSALTPSASTSSVLFDSSVAVSRQGSLTFAEPIGRTRSGSAMGPITELNSAVRPSSAEPVVAKVEALDAPQQGEKPR